MKNIIKRIIVGIGIALGVMLIKQNVFALSIYTTEVSSDSATQTFTSGNGGVNFGWNWGIWTNTTGYVSSSFTLTRDYYTDSRPTMSIKYVYAETGAGIFACDFGSTSQNNSQYVGWSYSYRCAITTGSTGLQYIRVGFSSQDNSAPVTYYTIKFFNRFTLEVPDSMDLSAVTSAQQQATNAINANTNAVNDVKNAVNRTNELLQDDSVNGATSTGGSFFSGFQSDSHGVSGVVTAPIRLVNAFTTESCSPLTFTLPFVHNQVTLQCMKPIYQNYFGSFFTLYQLITTGVLAYMVMINLFARVHDLQNPNNDRIAVLSL